MEKMVFETSRTCGSTLLRILKHIRTGGHWKTCNFWAFVCFLLIFTGAQALSLCGPQSSGQSSAHCHHAARRFFPMAGPVSDWNPQGRPTSLTEELESAEKVSSDVCLGRTARGNPESKNFNMLSRSARDTPVSRRAAVQLTSSRQAVEALSAFKAGISGGNLSIFKSWGADDDKPCGWIGVTCSTRTEEVTELSLVGYQLEGSIDSALLALGDLQSLERLDLSNNTFGGSISGTSLLNLSSLVFMNLSHNQIEGQIPHQIDELTNIQTLAFQFNDISGFSPSICNCSVLRELNFQGNLLRGHIPKLIGKLARLEVLDLSNWVDNLIDDFGRLGNLLEGGIPPSLGNCTSLIFLNTDLNNFGGPIPEQLGELRHLQMLSCTGCFLSGPLPRSIGNLTKLIEIHLSYNFITGPIPTEIGRLRSLSWLTIGQNYNLTGELPAAIGNCTSLERLRAGDMAISGLIPQSLSNCSLLKQLSLPNDFMLDPAPIPSWLSFLPRLEAIDMPNTNRYGRIPSELANLPMLYVISLQDNTLVGSIPSFGSNFTNLESIVLSNNSLTGLIPDEFGALVNLYEFDVSQNHLTGSIPNFIANSTFLYYLRLSGNSFGGTIDNRLAQLPYLYQLYLARNHFVGSVPSTLSNCSYLEQLFLEDNHLTGHIPSSFGNLSQLQDLIVSNNGITGEIPVDLARCSHLVKLDLSANKLEGPFLAGLARLPVLTSLNLSHNEFSGPIPRVIQNLTQIIWLDLSFNQFNGDIPWGSVSELKHMVSVNVSHNSLSGTVSGGLGTLIVMEEIDVSDNRISGAIPVIAGLRVLRRLDISLNNFSGNVPKFLASLPNLVFFNASYNNLDGPIPDFGSSQSNITSASFLGNPELCGSVLGQSRECPQNTSISAGKCKHFKCVRIWVPVVVASVAFVVLISAPLVTWTRRIRRSKTEGEKFDLLVNFRLNVLDYLPEDILAIIKDEGNLIGTTTASRIYKGLLPAYDNVIAVKTFAGYDSSDVDPREMDIWRSLLEREANLQSPLQHRNVLKLLSFCSHARFRALLLEYMPWGSLHDHLYPGQHRHPLGSTQVPEGSEIREDGASSSSSEQSCELPWSVRLSIAIDIAEGMTYLHHECPQPLIHGDLKPSNVLLDKNMVAKVSDFGVSKLVNLQRAGGDVNNGEATVSKICGTIGYMPPEYAFVASVSTKGDVYSYGVLLLEMLSGTPRARADLDMAGEPDHRNKTPQHFQESQMELLDSTLQQEARGEALKEKQIMLLAKVALFATRETPQSRPSMKEIKSMLSQIKGLEMEAPPRRRTVDELARDTDSFEVAVNSLNVWANAELLSGGVNS